MLVKYAKQRPEVSMESAVKDNNTADHWLSELDLTDTKCSAATHLIPWEIE